MRGLLYSFPVKLLVVLGAIVVAVIILLFRPFVSGIRGSISLGF